MYIKYALFLLTYFYFQYYLVMHRKNKKNSFAQEPCHTAYFPFTDLTFK